MMLGGKKKRKEWYRRLNKHLIPLLTQARRYNKPNDIRGECLWFTIMYSLPRELINNKLFRIKSSARLRKKEERLSMKIKRPFKNSNIERSRSHRAVGQTNLEVHRKPESQSLLGELGKVLHVSEASHASNCLSQVTGTLVYSCMKIHTFLRSKENRNK